MRTCKQNKICLKLLASRKLQGVEIGVGNSDVLCLASRVGAHGNVSYETCKLTSVVTHEDDLP